MPLYKMISDVLLAAGGEGKRMRPLTLTKPKPMLHVCGKPILEWNLEILTKFFENIYIVVGYKKEKIIEYFGDNYKGKKIIYINQEEQCGTGNAVALFENKFKKGKFLVVNGDLLFSEDLIKNFLIFAENYENSLCLTKVEDPTQFGVVNLNEEHLITDLEEKPKNPKSNLINTGIYVFNEKIFDILKNLKKSERGEYEVTDAIKILIKNKEIYGYIINEKNKEFWIDIGYPWNLLDANEILLKNIKSQIKGEVEEKAIIKNKENVFIGENTKILSGSYIIGPCYIGKNCLIGPNTFIRPYTSIGDNCHIGSFVEIKNSIIMNNSNVPHLSYVGDSIIGENCNLGAGTLIANLRHDNANVKVNINGNKIDSKRRKIGAIIGDNVKTGINTSILPGTVIYPNSRIQSHSMIKEIYQ